MPTLSGEDSFMRAAPDYLQFYPTTRCNRSCSFCFNNTLPPVDDMGPADFRTMLDVMDKAGIGTLDVIGGEPTLHKEIVGMLSAAQQQGLQVNVSSNGSDPDLLAEIIASGTDRLRVGVSVNEGETLDRLKPFIARYRPVVKSVHHRGMERAFIEEIIAAGPGQYYLLYRDALDPGGLNDTVSFDSFLSALGGGLHASGIGSVYCSGFLPDRDRAPELAQVRCPAGTTKLGVMPDGSVYPCNLFFGRPEFRLGNILTDPFESFWNHEGLAFFRAFSGNRCPRVSCAIHDQCHGGCPAHSLLHFGSLDGPEPRCIP